VNASNALCRVYVISLSTTECHNFNLEISSTCKEILVDKSDIHILLETENSAAWLMFPFHQTRMQYWNKTTYQDVSTKTALLHGARYCYLVPVTARQDSNKASAKTWIWCRNATPYMNYRRQYTSFKENWSTDGNHLCSECQDAKLRTPLDN
jgi:hypothetical protein